MTVERREFIKRAGLVGGAAAAVTALPGCRQLFHPPPFRSPALGSRPMLECAAADSGIDHVVVVMMENRSFDHWVGWLADDHAYLDAGRRRYGHHFCVDGRQHQTLAGPNGPVQTAHVFDQPDEANPYRGCDHPDPGHGWDQGRAQRDDGFLSAGSGNDNYAAGYYVGDDLPFTSQLARRFTVFDRYHASLLGPTFPNREYLHSAQSGGTKDNTLPIATGGFPWETIWERLDRSGVSSRYYYSDLPVLALWGTRVGGFLHPAADYFADCAAGTLPSVSYVDPKFLGEGRTDDHPHADIRGGQGFVRDVFNAFVESPHWHNGLFILTYDEWGGFFDHIAPPHFPDDRASAVDEDDFSQGGFRVPTVIASPFARPGFVDHDTYEHASVLRFLEWRFLGAPAEGPGRSGDSWFLTSRDRGARNLGASLLSRRVTDDIGFDPKAIQLAPITPDCVGDVSGFGLRASGAPELPQSDFQDAADSGYFEQVGAKILD